ncbi:hypothetical protein [Streptomyces purpurogeneiscleroticus]|uniref:hypothetical protein n=1 Tax=Streptomyces purpurogeneiscleroticus TaxID=68259 RepID=UPI001CBDA834|nr:hypothetical protein [Streptomyces purpurogeneiscleroticus]
MAAATRQLFVNSPASRSVTIDLGATTTFVAWGSITMLDPRIQFDRDNAVVIDIPFIDGNRTNTQVFGGDHWGAAGAFSNVHDSAVVRFGRTVTFRMRTFGPDIDAMGCGIVITNP